MFMGKLIGTSLESSPLLTVWARTHTYVVWEQIESLVPLSCAWSA
jgi:hypothetical protein